MKISKQKSSDGFWTDEKGTNIPYSRTTKSERLMEKQSFSLFQNASRINAQLKDFKNQTAQICDEVFKTFMEEHKNHVNKKGNFTWYNFDRSIRVVVNITEQIVFDDLHIQACKDKLDAFLNDNVDSKDGVIKQMILDAFETSRGRLDTKKVLSLLSYESKISNPLFKEAMNHLKDGIRRPSSKTYFQIAVKNDAGGYDNIDLNFSSI